MQTTLATSPGDPARANEDYAACGDGWAVILDGATHFPGVDTGCIHDVPWLVAHLAAGVTAGLTLGGDLDLADILAGAIRETCAAHEATCDLANPDSPSSTVAMIRTRGTGLDYLVLGDSPVILRRGDQYQAIRDDRLDHLPGGRPYSRELVRRSRNATGGFWVASTSPQAAYEALSGSVSGVSDAALLTDGVTRLADWYCWSWQRVFAVLLHAGGPDALLRHVREAERKAPPPDGKIHDDATVIYASSVSRVAGSWLPRMAFALD